MGQEEFNKLYRNSIVLKQKEAFIIIDFNKKSGTCHGLTLKRDERGTMVFESEVAASELDFFDINEETFLADCVKYEQPISDVCIDKRRVHNLNEYTIHNAIVVVCKEGLVKYFSLNHIGISFIKSVVNQYK